MQKPTLREKVTAQLIRYGRQMTLMDWREMRTPDYWKALHNASTELDRDLFILACMKAHLQKR